MSNPMILIIKRNQFHRYRHRSAKIAENQNQSPPQIASNLSNQTPINNRLENRIHNYVKVIDGTIIVKTRTAPIKKNDKIIQPIILTKYNSLF